jgi:hypothetical protein
MSSNYLIGAGLVATFAVALAACAGSMEDSAPKVVGEGGELVAKKQQWLQNYDSSCDVCFQAFELCKKGDGGLGTCTRSLNACVAGGLIKDDDDTNAGGDQNADDNGADEDVDAGVVDVGGDDEVDNGDDQDVDAGVDVGGDDEVDNNDDGNVDNGDDTDVDVDEATEEANRPNDGDQDGQPGDQVKQQLIEDIQACLDTAGECFAGDNADADACLDALKSCVSDALDGAFVNVCDGQRHRCQERNASEDETQSVEDLCNAGRDGEDNDDGDDVQ